MLNKAQSVKDKLKKISMDKKVEFNSSLRLFMYDRFIERLSISDYNENFILKGGFYLSSLFGIDNRNTMDIDLALKRVKLDKDVLLVIIQDIISIDLKDNITFNIVNIDTIRDEDEYGGLRVTIDFNLENIKDSFHIDVAAGDLKYNIPIQYGYKSIFSNDVYNLFAYSIEMVLVEKIETILTRLDDNSRMKDFYDIYLIYNSSEVNYSLFNDLFNKTLKIKNFNKNINECISIIENSNILESRWKSYSKKNSFAKNIEFIDIINIIKKILI